MSTHAVGRGEEEEGRVFKEKRGGKRLNVTQVTTVFLKEKFLKNPFGFAQDKTGKVDKKAQDVKKKDKYIHIYTKRVYMYKVPREEEEKERGGMDGRGGTGNWLTHRHTAPRRRHGLQFMLSG